MSEPSRGTELPVLEVIDVLRAALDDPGAAVLVAPPGTGKTTGVPPALLDEAWVGSGRIVVLEPRRLAARLAAGRMAELAGESVGETFGYSVRGERRTSAATRVEVVTEGLFVRRLQSDPTLDGVSGVLLDEFHERSIDTDLALALLLDVRQSLRPDLRVVVMSATLDAGPVAELLGSGAAGTRAAPVIEATAPMFAVQTHYRPASAHDPLEERVATVVVEALQNPRELHHSSEQGGDVLVFLPGRPEIHRTERVLERIGLGRVEVVALHGSLSPAEQEKVVHPDPGGPRRVILSTSLAETWSTVPAVRTVIDAGRRRTVRTDPHTGLPAMATVASSRSAADQRRGRAGRVGPGFAYRLWAESEDRHRPAADTPEIVDGDLAPLVLQLRAWGIDDPSRLKWLDPPDETAVERAGGLLVALGAVDGGRLTQRGRRMADIGFHPRLAAVAIAADADHLDDPTLAAKVLAVLETSRSGELDVAERVRSLQAGRAPGDALHAERQWRRALGGSGTRDERGTGRPESSDEAFDSTVAAMLLAGYPDRVARRRGSTRSDDRGREVTVFHLRSGGEVAIPKGPDAHHLTQAEWIVVADLDGGESGRTGRVHLGAAVGADVVLASLADQIVTTDVIEWDSTRDDLTAVRRRSLGAITLGEELLRDPPRAAVAEAVQRAVAADLSLLTQMDRAAELRARVAFLRAAQPTGAGRGHGSPDRPDWPDWSDEALADDVAGWLGPHLGRAARRSDLARIDVRGALSSQLDWNQRRALDELAPTHWHLPGGRKVPLRYGSLGGEPLSVTASIRLRDLIGTDEHPSVGGVPVSVELLSPAGRPLQRTADLPGFWRGSYAEVRSEMRGRYPKHPWPQRPWEPM